MSTFYNEVTYYTKCDRFKKRTKGTCSFKLADKRANKRLQREKKPFQKSRFYDRDTKSISLQ
mgnify:CR=1 FL=1|jgi:hypothetical protein